MVGITNEVSKVAQKLTTILNATLRYWAMYQAAADSDRLSTFVSDGDFETNGVTIVRVGMTRLTVLNIRRLLEPPMNRLNLMRLLELLPRNELHAIVSDPLIAQQSGIGDVGRRIAAIEMCRSQIEQRYSSVDAKWVRELRNRDIAHAGDGSGMWDERLVTQLHEFVMGTANEAYRLCDAICACHSAQSAYAHAYHEADAFWRCFRPS